MRGVLCLRTFAVIPTESGAIKSVVHEQTERRHPERPGNLQVKGWVSTLQKSDQRGCGAMRILVITRSVAQHIVELLSTGELEPDQLRKSIDSNTCIPPRPMQYTVSNSTLPTKLK